MLSLFNQRNRSLTTLFMKVFFKGNMTSYLFYVLDGTTWRSKDELNELCFLLNQWFIFQLYHKL